MRDLGPRYQFDFNDGSRIVISSDPTEDDWCGYPASFEIDVQLQTSMTPLSRAEGSLAGPTVRNHLSLAVTADLPIPDLEQRTHLARRLGRFNDLLREGCRCTWQDNNFQKFAYDLRAAQHAPENRDSDGRPTSQVPILLISQDPRVLGGLESFERPNNSTFELWNHGDVRAFPVFYVYGPFTQFQIENLDTGQKLVGTYTLEGGGAYVKVDCQPVTKGVTKNGNQPLRQLPDFAYPLDLHIRPNNTDRIAFSATGGDAETRVHVMWRHTWSR